MIKLLEHYVKDNGLIMSNAGPFVKREP
jgi:hypothetical protein